METISVLVYGSTTTWWASLPRKQAEAAWGKEYLIWPTPSYWRLWSALFWSFGLCGIVAAVVGNINMVWALLAMLFVWPLGWGLGWSYGIQMEKTKNEPIYAVRSTWSPPGGEEDSEGSRTAVPFRYEQLVARVKRSRIREVLRVKSTSPNGNQQPKDEEIEFMPAWSDSFVFHRYQMIDEKEHRKGGLSKWQKLQYGSMGVIALCLVGMVFFAVIALQDKEPIPPRPVSAIILEDISHAW